MKGLKERGKERGHVRRREIFLAVKAKDRELGLVCTRSLLVGTKLFQEGNGAISGVRKRK